MALGFGFNKQKSQAAAEKYVQQGKLQNAIAEYEKIIQEDPKDLNVVNTIGDLYQRLGENSKAAACFKRVGESLTSEGFTPKAIAVFRKLLKLVPDDREVSLKLAELFTQQGLYTEARTQYMHLAEQYLRAHDLTQAVRIFQKMLEIDPDNTSIQSKLAELLIKTGKPQEAKDIFSRTAGVLRGRGDTAGAKAILDKLLQIDANNPDALLQKGMLAAEAGDYRGAITQLEKVPNLDSAPDALLALFKAYLQAGALEKSEGLAQVLYSVHKDVAGLALYAQALMDAGESMPALAIYDEYASEFLARDRDGLLQTLQGAISRVKDNAAGLEVLRNVYQKTGESTYNNEVIELLAHAYVQEGKLDRAAQLYQELANAEPENPLHAQNYKQIVARLGSDPIYRAPSSDEGNQAFMIEELEDMSRPLPQQHPPELEDRIQAALTESELFSSYNLPEKAIAPLENALSAAPYDIQLNQRLASLYTRVKRFSDAADRCEVLAQVYGAAGHGEEAQQYADFVQRYRGGPATPVPTRPIQSVQPEPAVSEWPAAEPVQHQPVVQEFPQPAPPAGSVKEFEFEVVQESQHTPQEAVSSAPVAQPSTHEIDLSNEWEDMLTTEEPASHASEPATVLEMPIPRPGKAMPSEISQARSATSSKKETPEESRTASLEAAMPVEVPVDMIPPQTAPPREEPRLKEISAQETPIHEVDAFEVEVEAEPVEEPVPVDTVPERVEEIRSYLAQSMFEEARAAIAKLESDAPTAPQLEQLKSKLAALEAAAKPTKPKIDKAAIKTPVPPARTPTPIKPLEVKAPEAKPVTELKPVAEVKTAEVRTTEAKPVEAKPVEVKPVEVRPTPSKPVETKPVEVKPAAETKPVIEVKPAASPKAPAAKAPKAPFEDLLELSLDDVIAEPASPAKSNEKHGQLIEIPLPPRTSPQQPKAFGSDNLLEDIDLPMAPSPGKDILGNLANDLSNSLDGDFLETPPLTAPPQAQAQTKTNAGAAKQKGDAKTAVAKTSDQKAGSATKPAIDGVKAEKKPAAAPTDAAAMLADLFDEFKEDVEQQTAEDKDLDTHYNLGIAFREMGLLDEAIGELQKVCNAIEKGAQFEQIIQAYTWLAQCLMDRSFPEAAIRWYERALKIPQIEADNLIAIYYDLASAYEKAGNKKAAADNYMQACSMNIDYRDVVEKIKALQP